MPQITTSDRVERIERERRALQQLLARPDCKYHTCYLGGGDFLVHATGIDPAIDRIISLMKNENDLENEKCAKGGFGHGE